MMLARQARDTVRRWVMEDGCQAPGFLDTSLHGSMNRLPGHVAPPSTSGVDVMVPLEGHIPPVEPGESLGGAIIEASYLPAGHTRSDDQALGVSPTIVGICYRGREVGSSASMWQ